MPKTTELSRTKIAKDKTEPFWRISGKTLGQLCLPDFCPRCFWIRQNLASRRIKEPWQIFPGIFSSLDSYSKKLVHGHFDTFGKPPPWLSGLGNIKGYRPPPSAQKFYVIDPATNILLTGAPDAVFDLEDGTIMIADYKTARYTKNQDSLAPLYECQLNAYRYIGISLGWPEISRLALIYTEPITSFSEVSCNSFSEKGFDLSFSVKIKEIICNESTVIKCLKNASNIILQTKMPNILPDCNHCASVLAISSL